MSQTRHHDTNFGLPDGASGHISARIDDFAQFPRGESFSFHEVPMTAPQLNYYHHQGILRRVGTAESEHDNEYALYVLADSAAQFIDDVSEARDTFDCGHGGLHTIVPGEEYSCGDEDCDATYDHETALEVMG